MMDDVKINEGMEFAAMLAVCVDCAVEWLDGSFHAIEAAGADRNKLMEVFSVRTALRKEIIDGTRHVCSKRLVS